jgi:type I restriction enzyme R subunit
VTETSTEEEPGKEAIPGDPFDSATDDGQTEGVDDVPKRPKKYYVDGGNVEIATNVVWDLDADGKRFRVWCRRWRRSGWDSAGLV